MGSAISSGSARANEAIMKALDSPLLNDNKIQGAKNVLLLIVSGVQEITIDEIGEINDHIQIEAGYGANIIMGVGEDESLGEAIAVTVIATGFNIEQQDDIVNTESKKIIHTLEDGQRAEAMLLSNSKTVHTLEVDEEEEVVKEVKPVQKYEFVDEADFDLIPTTNYIKNFNVFYEEVVAHNVSEDDFVIVDSAARDIEVVDPEVLKANKVKADDLTLGFDMPLKNEEKENVITFDLHEEVKDLDVNDSIEIIPVLEYNKNGEKRYSLDDYMQLESKLTGAKSKAEEFEPKIIEDELIFEKRTVAPKREIHPDEHLDPMETPIEELLRERADERRRKLKDFNYKFKTSAPSSYDEKKPAYQRQGVNLNDNPKESKISRTSLSSDSNEDIKLRSNNSFLHDNVD
jgi:cell division protein FtsZ